MAGKSYSVKAIIQGIDHLTAPLRRIGHNIHSILTPALRGVGRVASLAGRAIRGILSPLGLLAGGGIIAGLGGLLKSFISTGDSIGEFAAQVGISARALQEYEYAAERAGVESSTFRRSLEFFGRTVGKARTEGGKFSGVLGEMPEAFRKALAGAGSMEQGLSLALGALGAVKDASERAALAQALFGKSGARMALLAAQGADGIQALREEAQRLGVVLSDEAVRAAGDADDKMIRLKGAVRGLKTTIASELLPTLLPLIERLTDWISKNRDLIGQKIGDFIRGIVEWIGKIDFAAIGRGLSDFWDGVKRVFDLIGGVKGLLVGIGLMTFGPLVASLGPVGIALAGLLALVASIGTGLDALNNRGKQSRKWAQTNARVAALTGSPQEARNALEAQARSERDTRLRGLVGQPFGGRLGSRAMGPILGTLFGSAVMGAPTTAADYVSAARQTPKDIASALRDILAAGPPTASVASALALDITVRRDGGVDIQPTSASGPVTATVHGPAAGVRTPTLRGR